MNKKIPLFALGMLVIGATSSMAVQSFAQTTMPTTTTPSATTTSSGHNKGDWHQRGQRHSPLGHDGLVKSINGTTIIMSEEADEGGALYTVDASNAVIVKDGATSTISAIVVGDKIFVKGEVGGTNVKATHIFDGHGKGNHGFWKKFKKDKHNS